MKIESRLFISLLVLMIFPLLNVTFAQEVQYDDYGGRMDLKIDEGNGFFRLGEINGKHFLVTPEGNAFRAIGLNHSHTLTSKDYDQIIADMKSMGFNSGDYQGPQWQWNRIPYSKGIQLVETSTWLPENQFSFEDVFDPEFLSSLENKIKYTVQAQAQNANLICYFFTDTPVWEIQKYGTGWIDFYRSLAPDSPGGTKWKEWKEENPNAPEADFIPIIARQLYAKAVGYVKKYDSNHLIFGDRYIEYHFPESALKESLPYVDGIAIQPKNILNFEWFDEVYEKYKRPIFICDHVSSFATDDYPNTMGQVADNIEDYVEVYRSSVQGVMAKPYIVGFNKCQYQDELNGNQLKQGLYKLNGDPYEYLDSLSSIHLKALDTAYLIPLYDKEEEARKLLDWGGHEDVKQEAIERIEQHRKGDLTLQVFFSEDDTLVNARIRAKLQRHDFNWGAVVRASFATSPYSEVYKEVFARYFNASGFGIELKPKWRGTSNEENAANLVMPWMLKNDVYVRGHALTWEGLDYLRPEDKAIYNDGSLTDQEKGDSLLVACGKHFSHAIPKWDVNCWDVSNEPMANNLINDLLPAMNSHVYWFKLADSIRRECGKEDVKLYQNDYQVISAIVPWALNFTKPGYSAKGRPAVYREILDEQLALGAPIEGIGFQSRLKKGLITPDSIYKRLCDFDRFNLPFQATEFEIRDDVDSHVYTDEERRLLTEYMMVMYLSHPKVNGFWHWTFADVRDNVDWDYSLFNFDGTPKINGQIWMDLMDGFFTSDKTAYTNGKGEADVRGYYGTYNLIAEDGNKIYIGSFNIDSTMNDPVIPVYLDKGFTISGLEENAAYALDQVINIDVSAFSNYGDISSIGIFINMDSISGETGSTLSMNYTPDASDEGWNEVSLRFFDKDGNSVRHTMDVYFGSTLPKIEFLSLPDETIYTNTTGNSISFGVAETYTAIDSIIVNYADNTIILTDTSGTFKFMLDDLPVGDHEFVVEAIDIEGSRSSASHFFVVEEAVSVPVPRLTGTVVYPNPASSTLNFTTACDYKIFTLTGILVLAGRQALQVDISALARGLYLVKTNEVVTKLIKQ